MLCSGSRAQFTFKCAEASSQLAELESYCNTKESDGRESQGDRYEPEVRRMPERCRSVDHRHGRIEKGSRDNANRDILGHQGFSYYA
jgi:hypothetical protein